MWKNKKCPASHSVHLNSPTLHSSWKGTCRMTYRVSILVTFVSFCLAKCPACEHSAHCQLSQPVKSLEPFLSPLILLYCDTIRWERRPDCNTVSVRQSCSDVAYSYRQPITLCAATCVYHTDIYAVLPNSDLLNFKCFKVACRESGGSKCAKILNPSAAVKHTMHWQLLSQCSLGFFQPNKYI